ncbi:homoserine kinase [Bacteroidota bacterium]
MGERSIRVFAPASVSNIGPGFDIMGFAIKEPGDEIIIKRRIRGGIKITKIISGRTPLPQNPSKNTATVAINSLFKEYDLKYGIDVQIHKGIGIGSGLGSSAASAVAGVYAVNKLFNLNLPKIKLLKHALKGEQIASGEIHADNVAPCLLGGYVLIRSYNPLDILPIKISEKLYCAILYPLIEIRTSEARKMLGKTVSLKKSVEQTGNAIGLTIGLLNNDYDLISRSLKDVIVEPKRAKLIPGYYYIKQAALDAGAIGCNISGSGPSIFTLCKSSVDADRVRKCMKMSASKFGFNHKFYISKINKIGPKIS